jgi:ABC-type antimicrobial peptide transport system permease subunit
VYVAFENFPVRDMHLVVHAGTDPGELARAVRAEIGALAPALPITRITTMDDLTSESLAGPRFNLALLLAFAVVALVLATVGIYGVISYSVVRRTGEIGLRMALGSDALGAFRLVVGETLAWVGVGAVLGVGGSVLVSRFVRGLVYEVSPLDPVTVAATLVIVFLTASAAAAAPARRATRVDPVRALDRG